MTEKTDSSVINGEVISPAIGKASPKAAQEAEKRADAEALINQLIAETKRDPSLSESERAARLSALEGARSTGNITQMNNAIANYGTSSGRADGTNALMMQAYADDPSLGYGGYGDYPYSKEAKSWIFDKMQEARKSSSIFNDLVQSVERLSPEQRKEAENKIGENFKMWKQLKNNPDFMAKIGPEAATMIDDFKLARHADFKKVIEQIEQGNDPAEALRKITKMRDEQIQLASSVAEQIIPKLSAENQKFYREQFGTPADMSKYLKELNSIDPKERNAVLTKFAKKEPLNEHEQRVMKILELSVPIDGAQMMKAIGAIAIAKDQSLMTEITRGGDVNERAEKLESFMRNNGYSIYNSVTNDRLAERMIAYIDKDPEAAKLLKAGKMEEFSARFEADQFAKFEADQLAQRTRSQGMRAVRDLDNQIAANESKQEMNYSTAIRSFMVEAEADKWSDGEISRRDRLLYTPEQIAEKQKEWQAIEDEMAKAYTPEAQAAASVSAPAVKTAEEKAAEAAMLAANPEKAYYDQLAAEALAKAEAEAEKQPAAASASAEKITTVAGLRAMENAMMAPEVAKAAMAAGAGLAASGTTGDGKHLLVGDPPSVVVATALHPERNGVGPVA